MLEFLLYLLNPLGGKFVYFNKKNAINFMHKILLHQFEIIFQTPAKKLVK